MIHLADGRTINVPHRDFVWQTQRGDSFSFLDLSLVTDLEFVNPADTGA